ncbi:Fur-regulated basic protein FbpA [Rossellomorea aquimaris]|uniref:Fur-regulated basic protein FbpA n=1 Tax=Rossellomorea aquimaris TaxID=189382 RepID=UPI0007D07332|nr:Fur-regulated basic protein FbpA [Rossellomorea aquimaris]
MGQISQEAVEKRRQELINKLLIYNVYKKEDRQLFELTLLELETEYKLRQKQQHPHSDYGSIQWRTCKKETS